MGQQGEIELEIARERAEDAEGAAHAAPIGVGHDGIENTESDDERSRSGDHPPLVAPPSPAGDDLVDTHAGQCRYSGHHSTSMA